MGYYERSIEEIRLAIEARFPGTTPQYSRLERGKVAPLSYILWMCDQIQNMDQSSPKMALKAARWIGWMFAHMEMAVFWDNEKSREYVRRDREKGLDQPETMAFIYSHHE